MSAAAVVIVPESWPWYLMPARIRKAREEATRRNNVPGEPVEETEPEAEAATPKPKKTKKAPEWKSLPDAEKAQYLLDHPTLSDRAAVQTLANDALQAVLAHRLVERRAVLEDVRRSVVRLPLGPSIAAHGGSSY